MLEFICFITVAFIGAIVSICLARFFASLVTKKLFDFEDSNKID